MQYTLRGIPEALDRAIRRRAQEEGRSINETAVDALAHGLGIGKQSVPRRDLSDIVGTWKKEAAVEDAIASQDTVDEDLWK
jgi:hypothetical protein